MLGIEKKKRDKKARLVKAGTSLFAEKGFFSTTVDEITRKAGVAKGTFYLYFQDKNELLRHILQQLSSQHEASYSRLKFIQCPRERLEKYIINELEFYAKNADFARLNVNAFGIIDPSLINWYLDIQKKHITFLTQIITEGCEKGFFSVRDSRKAARFLRGAIFMFLAHQIFSPEQEDITMNSRFIMDVFLQGVEKKTYSELRK